MAVTAQSLDGPASDSVYRNLQHREYAGRLALPSFSPSQGGLGRSKLRHYSYTRIQLTGRQQGTKWRYGAPTLNVVRERLDRAFPLLQEAGRAGHGTVSRRGIVYHVGCRVQFHRHHRETYGREYALAVDGFSDHRWREARPQPRHGIRERSENARCADGTVGARMEIRFRCAGAADGC